MFGIGSVLEVFQDVVVLVSAVVVLNPVLGHVAEYVVFLQDVSHKLHIALPPVAEAEGELVLVPLRDADLKIPERFFEDSEGLNIDLHHSELTSW